MSPVAEQKNPNHLPKAMLWVVIVAIIAIALVMLMVFWMNKNEPTTAPSVKINTESESTADTVTETEFKKYTSDLGFSLNIPNGVERTNALSDSNNRLVMWEGMGLEFEVRYKNDATTTIENYIHLDFPRDSFSILGGEKANVTKSTTGYCDGPGCGDPFIAYTAKKGNDFVSLVFYGDVNLSDIEQDILDSFTFIKSSAEAGTRTDDIAGWNACEWKQYGITFKYPSEWTCEQKSDEKDALGRSFLFFRFSNSDKNQFLGIGFVPKGSEQYAPYGYSGALIGDLSEVREVNFGDKVLIAHELTSDTGMRNLVWWGDRLINEYGNFTYSFHMTGDGSMNFSDSDIATAEKIISSIKISE